MSGGNIQIGSMAAYAVGASCRGMMHLFDGLAILLEKFGADEEAYMPFQMMPDWREG